MKMKKYKCMIAMLLVALLLTGCTDALFTTAEYRCYQSFVDKYNAGIEKQEILDKLGCPDGYVDAQGNNQSIKPADQKSFEENLAEDSSDAWMYECWKFPDPAEPYRLKITFDADGKSESAELMLVHGG